MSKTVRYLATAGMLAALDIIFTRFLSFLTPDKIVRVGPQFLAHAMTGWLLGPLWALGTAIAGDILGMFINSGGISFMPGYMVSAAVSGLIYGLILYRKPVSIWRSVLAVACVTVVVSLGLNSLWSVIYYGKAWLGVVLAALPWRLVLLPVYSAVLYMTQKALERARIPLRLQDGF